MSIFGVILVRILPHSGDYVSLSIHSECGKNGPGLLRIRTLFTQWYSDEHCCNFRRNGIKKSNSHQKLANIWVGKRDHDTKKTPSRRYKEGSNALSEAVV